MSLKAKQMLDALMGPCRDLAAKDRKDDWKERTVCKKYLIGFCPYDKSVLGGRRGIEACPKIHNDLLREKFKAHEDGAENSSFRRECEDIAIRDLQECMLEKDAYARKQLENLKAEAKIRRLPDEVNSKISMMKREAAALKEKATALEDCEARLKEQLEQQAATATADLEAYIKEEERKAQLAQPVAKTCDICGTGYKGDEEYQAHLSFRVHTGYQQVHDELEKLREKKNERSKKEAEEKKQKRIEEFKKQEEKSAEKSKKEKDGDEKDKGGDEKEKGKDSKDKERDGDEKDRRSRSRDRRKGKDSKDKERDGDRKRRNRSASRGGADGITKVTQKDKDRWDRSESGGRRGKRSGRKRSASRSRSRNRGRSRSKSRRRRR